MQHKKIHNPTKVNLGPHAVKGMPGNGGPGIQPNNISVKFGKFKKQ